MPENGEFLRALRFEYGRRASDSWAWTRIEEWLALNDPVFADANPELAAFVRNHPRSPVPSPETSVPAPLDGRTHYDGCWETRGHHDCAIAKVGELLSEVERLQAAPRREPVSFICSQCPHGAASPAHCIACLQISLEESAAEIKALQELVRAPSGDQTSLPPDRSEG